MVVTFVKRSQTDCLHLSVVPSIDLSPCSTKLLCPNRLDTRHARVLRGGCITELMRLTRMFVLTWAAWRLQCEFDLDIINEYDDESQEVERQGAWERK